VLENPLPYPRDSRSPEFQRLVSLIHEAITRQILPDLPPEVQVAGEPISRARKRMESIPLVSVGQVLGLMSLLNDNENLSNIYDISDEIGEEFGQTIAIVKAAEILEFVDTPKQDVYITELGRRFMAADRVGRRQIFAEQVDKLRIFHIILALLHEAEEIDADSLIKDIASALPFDNPERTFETMIAWGRYAGLMDFNPKTGQVFVPGNAEASEH
jgi:NitT/TauT family transport system ATP-binding protein